MGSADDQLDVTDENSVAVAVKAILAAEGKIDCVVHNAGRGWMGPAEAFTPEQMADAFDINVLGASDSTARCCPE